MTNCLVPVGFGRWDAVFCQIVLNGFKDRRWIAGSIMAMLLLTCPTFSQEQAPDFVWIEGESAKTSHKVNIAGWGRPQFLSEGKWLHLSVDQGNVEKEVSEEGILLQYDFTVLKVGAL